MRSTHGFGFAARRYTSKACNKLARQAESARIFAKRNSRVTSVRHIQVMAHQKIRFGMRTLQAASEDFTLNFLVRLAPSVARISISRTGHHYLHMSNTSAYAGFFFLKTDRRAARKELRACLFYISIYIRVNKIFHIVARESIRGQILMIPPRTAHKVAVITASRGIFSRGAVTE